MDRRAVGVVIVVLAAVMTFFISLGLSQGNRHVAPTPGRPAVPFVSWLQGSHAHLIPAARVEPGANSVGHYAWNPGDGHHYWSTVNPNALSRADHNRLKAMLRRAVSTGDTRYWPHWWKRVYPSPAPHPRPAPTARPTARPVPTAQPPSCPGSADQCYLLGLINVTRGQYGRSALALLQDSTTAQHARDEAGCLCIFHQDARFPGESFPYGGFFAENTGYASSTDAVHDSMMAEGTATCSQGTLSHACNLIDPRWTEIALGIETGQFSWGTAYFVVEDFK